MMRDNYFNPEGKMAEIISNFPNKKILKEKLFMLDISMTVIFKNIFLLFIKF